MRNSTLPAAALLLSGLLSACGALSQLPTPTPNPTPAPNPAPTPTPTPTPPASNTLGTVITNWGSTGTAEADLDLTTVDGSALNTLAKGDIAADGSFSLTLPDDATIQPYDSKLETSVANSGPNCTGNFTYGDAATMGRFFSTLNVRQAGALKGYMAPGQYGGDVNTGSVTYTGSAYLYADRDTTVQGTVNCTDSSGSGPATLTYTINVNLKKGWNATAVAASFTAATSTYAFDIKDGGAFQTNWLYFPQSGASTQAINVNFDLNTVLKYIFDHLMPFRK